MYTYVARQPILNKQQETYGHELLFRDGENNTFPINGNENRASYRVVADNFLSETPLTSRSFINFSYEAIIWELPLSLPKNQVVIEIQSTSEPDNKLFGAVRKLHRLGYTLVLDDYNMDPKWDRFIPYVRIIKIDVLHHGVDVACDYVIEQINTETEVSFLAAKIETEEEFEAAYNAGFRYFQGYFFGKPKIVKQKHVSPEGVLALQLLAEVAKEYINYKTVENLINKDVYLSYKLLRFVNTLSPRLEHPIASFHEAVVYLGQDKLKIFVSLAIASYVSTTKPSELYKQSMQRAHFCQLMGQFKPFKQHAEHLFLLGMFSKLDALLDSPIEPLLKEIPLSQAVKNALISRDGELGLLLQLEENYEYADWDEIENLCTKLKLPFSEVTRALCQAQFWESNLV